MTAHHVIDGASDVAVVFPGREPVPARVVRASATTDVALLSIDAEPPDFVALAGPSSAQLGSSVFTIGFPALDTLGFEPKFTEGSISALSAMSDAAFLQISVPVHPGNSGGPLLDERGEVVGVVVARISDERFFRDTGTIPQNINFASKAESVRALGESFARRAPAASRAEAIERASRSVCAVLVRH